MPHTGTKWALDARSGSPARVERRVKRPRPRSTVPCDFPIRRSGQRSRTMIRSARRDRRGRWAITTAVRPSRTSSRAFRSPSRCGYRPLKWLRRDQGSAVRRGSPGEGRPAGAAPTADLSLADFGPRPSLRRSMNGWPLTASAAAAILDRGVGPAGRRAVLGVEPENGSLPAARSPSGFAGARCRWSGQRPAVNQRSGSCGSWNLGMGRARVDLPGTGAADRGNRLTRFDLEVGMSRDRPARCGRCGCDRFARIPPPPRDPRR